MDCYLEGLLALLLALPRWEPLGPETNADRFIRMAMTTAAMVEAAEEMTCTDRGPECVPVWNGSSHELTFAIFSAARHESLFAWHIHADRCRVDLGECDGGKAKGMWQVWQTPAVPLEEWKAMGGLSVEATFVSAHVAGRLLAKTRSRCGSWYGAFSQYATGDSCRWSGARLRIKTMKKAIEQHQGYMRNCRSRLDRWRMQTQTSAKEPRYASARNRLPSWSVLHLWGQPPCAGGGQGASSSGPSTCQAFAFCPSTEGAVCFSASGS